MNSKIAIKLLLCMFGAVILFHFSILFKLIPYDISWGGHLKNDTEMYAFEAVSILINVLLIVLVLIKGKLIKAIVPLKFVNSALWVFFVLFCLNTLANFFAATNFEKYFSILTAAAAYLIWVILKKPKPSASEIN